MDTPQLEQFDVLMKQNIDTWVKAQNEKDEVRAKELREEASKREAELAAINEQLGKVKLDAESMTARQRNVEQKLDGTLANFDTGTRRYRTPGQQVVESEAFLKLQKNVVAGQGITISLDSLYMEPQAVITNPNPPVMTQPLVDPAPRQLIAPATRQLTIRNLLPSMPTNTNLVPYTVENVVTDNAGPQVGENTALGESNITFTLASLPVETVGTFIKMSEQILEDAPALQAYIDGRMRNLLAVEEEDQLLLGSGLSNNLTGLAPQATDYDNSLNVSGDNKIDILRHAILQVRKSHFAADGIVLNSSDWHAIELIKHGSGDARYVYGNPSLAMIPSLWGLPVVDTLAMTEGDFLVGNFGMACMINDRRLPTVQLSISDASDFTKLMVTLRVHERLCLVVYRPLAVVTGDFNWPTGSPI